jgi:hypothetical protein
VSFLEVNLATLSRRQPGLAHLITGLPPGPVEVFPSVSGAPSARFTGTPAPLLLHSRYDPVKEARDALSKQDLSGDGCFVFLGFGLGYLLDALLESQPPGEGSYFVVESSLHVLRAAFEARDLRRILDHPRLHFAWPVAGAELREQWQRFFDPVRAERCTFLTHAASIALAPASFKAAAELIQTGTFQILTDINTLVARSHEFLGNFCRNFRKASVSPGVSAFAGRFSGVPAVIVSAGPSLDRNIHELRGKDEHVLMLSTDTALKPLLAAGVEPHFVLTADPGHRNYLHLKGCATARSLLVAESTAYPDVFGEFPGRTVSCTFRDSSLGALAAIFAEKGFLKAWGSVATMALDFALTLGCDPVIFAGQDLAYSGGRSYCSGLYTEAEWFSGVLSPEDWIRRCESLKSGHKIVMMEDVFGRPVETTDKLAAYWNWMVKEIESHPETRFVNATEGGILRQGVETASLRDVLHRCCSRRLELRERVESIFRSAARAPQGGAERAVARLVSQSRQVLRELESGLTLARQTDGESARSLFLRLEKTKESLYRVAPELSSLLDSFNQVGNVTFLRNRNRLAHAIDPSAGAVRAVYGEYFAAVRAALDGILPSLLELGNPRP